MDKAKLDRLDQESRARASRIGSVEVAEAMIHADRAKALVEVGGDLDEVTNNVGWTPLMMAVRRGDLKNADALVRAGAGLDLRDSWGETALMMAVRNGHSGVAKVMVEKGADLDVRNNKGDTALMMATAWNLEVAKPMVEKGAGLDVQNNDGWTALMVACKSGNPGAINLLVEKGASLDVKNNKGRTAEGFLHEGTAESAEGAIDACLEIIHTAKAAKRAAELDRKLDQACEAWSPPTASTNSIKTRQASTDTLTQVEQQAPVSRSRQRF